jgi:hypothetical protein
VKLSYVAGTIALAMAGCSSSSGGSGGTCTVSSVGFCIDYIGSSYNPSAVQSMCSQQGGSYSTSACPTAAAGTCDFHSGTSMERKWTFIASPDTGFPTDGGNYLQEVCVGAGGTYSGF